MKRKRGTPRAFEKKVLGLLVRRRVSPKDFWDRIKQLKEAGL